MRKPPAFQFYPKDFLADINVTIMSMEERGVYITLLSHLWLEGKLPNDERVLKRLCNYSHNKNEKWADIWAVVGCCFRVKRGRLSHKRLDEEREKQNEWREKCSLGGQIGAQKRWGATPDKNKGSYKGAITMPIVKHSSSSSSSSKETKKNNPPKGGLFVPDDKPSRTVTPKILFNFTTESWENINDKDIERWTETYPACDIKQELKKAADWLIANPTKRKSNYKAFLSRWISREQDKGGTRSTAPKKKYNPITGVYR